MYNFVLYGLFNVGLSCVVACDHQNYWVVIVNSPSCLLLLWLPLLNFLFYSFTFFCETELYILVPVSSTTFRLDVVIMDIKKQWLKKVIIRF